MEPSAYIPAYLERIYLESHPDLTDAARELVRKGVATNPGKYAQTEHAQALLSYMGVRDHLLDELDRIEDMPDSEFEQTRNRLFDEARDDLLKICRVDALAVDAQLLAVILADTPVDACLGDLMKLEAHARDYLVQSVSGFDLEAPHYWTNAALAEGATAAELTASEPVLIGWLHTLESISQLCLASARYRAGAAYARRAMKAAGYPTRAAGTVLLALARLENEDGFFELAHELEEASGAERLEDSPWYLLARTLLLYKTDKMKPAKRALREFANRCEGGAFFLLNPTYLTPYLPTRPAPRDPWDLAHQAVWEADGIITDTPDFAPWAASVEGVRDISSEFARRYGF